MWQQLHSLMTGAETRIKRGYEKAGQGPREEGEETTPVQHN
jgi:hypothetical protein